MNGIVYQIVITIVFSSLSTHFTNAGLLDEALVLEPGGVARVDIKAGRSPRVFNQVIGSGRIAVDSEGIFVLGGGGSITQHDLDTGELLGGFGPSIFLQSPKDFAIDVNGDFIVSDDSGFYRIDREKSGSTKLFNDDRTGREVEIGADGTIIVSDASGPVPLGLLVIRPDAEPPERITNGEFSSLAVHPSGDLIAVHHSAGTEAIVRVDLETGEILQTRAPFTLRNMQVDAIGRIVGFRDNSIVRIDLITGEVEEVLLASRRVFDLTLFPVELSLQPGDANQDLQFDPNDIVHVLSAGKYLAGTAATWGEGDWNGGPGGRPYRPPTGDGRFDQLDIVAALSAGIYLSGPYAALEDNHTWASQRGIVHAESFTALAAGGEMADARLSIVYDALTGDVAVDVPTQLPVTAVNVASKTQDFDWNCPYENCREMTLIRAAFGGTLTSFSFGEVAAPRLTQAFLLSDLTVLAALQDGEVVEDVDLVYIPVPEPATFVLLLTCHFLMVHRLRFPFI